MSGALEDNIKRWRAKRQLALVVEIIQGAEHITPVASPQSNGMSEAFVKALKSDYVRGNPLSDAEAVLKMIEGWIEDYNANHPHSGLKWKLHREVIRARTETA